MDQDPKTVYGVLQQGAWSSEVDDHFLAVLTFGSGAVFQIEASNNGRMPLPRWYVVGTKGTLVVTGKSEPFWDEAELNYITESGKRESQKFTFYDICESGAEGGFYEDIVPFLDGKIKSFISMHEASQVIKALDLIRKSSETGEVIAF
jgi:predicted dehydrogenase